RVAVFRAWLTLDDSVHVPRRLLHRFSFAPNPAVRIARTRADTDAALVITCGEVAIDARPVIALAPPLGGGLWRASGGAGSRTYHIGVGVVDGRARLPERFAVDFQKVDSAGSILPNPFPADLENAMFYSNRAEVFAVADAEVAFVRD